MLLYKRMRVEIFTLFFLIFNHIKIKLKKKNVFESIYLKKKIILNLYLIILIIIKDTSVIINIYNNIMNCT